MDSSPTPDPAALAHSVAAPQHGPRPLPLFLSILWRETEHDPELRQRAFVGLRRYQQAQRPAAPPPATVVAQCGQARLLQYGTDNGRIPVVFVPSLINPPRVLDLSEQNSMLRHMAAAGHDAMLVDWGKPSQHDAAIDLTGHVTDRLIPLIATLRSPPILVGYCLGGTLSLAAAMLHPVAGLVTIAAPWQFDGFQPADRAEIASLWQGARPMCDRLGYMPMEVLQSGFWAMDPARTIRKYAAFADMEEESDTAHAFMAVEDWANAGPPLTYAAARQLFEDFYAANASGQGVWAVGGRSIAAEEMSCPSLSIRSTTDRIVPAAASPDLVEDWRFPLGHVGMIVSRRARETLWMPLSQWLCSHGG